jgi:FixJ family two-component response regulator
MLTEAHRSTAFVVSADASMRVALLAAITGAGRAAQGFASVSDFCSSYDVGMPGCLILDVAAPVSSALEAYERLVREGKRMPVVFLVEGDPAPTANGSPTTGAIGFLEKKCEGRMLADHVLAALELDKQWRAREVEHQAVSQRIKRLSDREQDTLDLMLSGASDKAMASKLYVSPRAVEMRREAIMRKLQVRSLGELLEVAVTQRILTEIASTLSAAWLRG